MAFTCIQNRHSQQVISKWQLLFCRFVSFRFKTVVFTTYIFIFFAFSCDNTTVLLRFISLPPKYFEKDKKIR